MKKPAAEAQPKPPSEAKPPDPIWPKGDFGTWSRYMQKKFRRHLKIRYG
ncbi:MAG: hypothetical protein KGI66_01155 [Patescibacteria group bacterium]|nr:hypothetical protein [Patescibacteria group bacterium]